MNIVNDLLSVDAGDDFEVDDRDISTGRQFTVGNPNTLIIKSTVTPDALFTKNLYLQKNHPPAHLILSRDGDEVIQMVKFNRQASGGFQDRTAISISLVNASYLLTLDKNKNHFRHVDKYSKSERITAFGAHDNKFRFWLVFPPEQLDLLLKISKLLMTKYNLKSVRLYEEIAGGLRPGPAFPAVVFRELLKAANPGMEYKAQMLEETSEEVILRSGPGSEHEKLIQKKVPKDKPVSILDDTEGWSLIEVLEMVNGQNWLKGWVQSKSLKIKKFTPVVRDHYLESDEGRRVRVLNTPGSNFNAKKEIKPKYVIMHYTTGSNVRQTINTFTNAAKRVSAHLLIGRDGRVYQFVPFNRPAYHTGFSFWEGLPFINNHSIGIEIDNSGYLKDGEKENGHWVRNRVVIPGSKVKSDTHFKHNEQRNWEAYTPEQIEIARSITKALIKHYTPDLEPGEEFDILGHDDITKYKLDPGPLFTKTMQDWREDIFNRREAKITKYHTISEKTALYKVFEGDFEDAVPRLGHPEVANIKLRDGNQIFLIDKQRIWSVVRWVSGSRPRGWVRTKNIRELTTIVKITGDKVKFYQLLSGKTAGPPPTEHWLSPVPQGTRFRILKVDKKEKLVMVAALDLIRERKNVKGWVREEDIEKIPD
ncbi:MAG: hypothetical protein FVQ83_10240 [Chloroflexi bacterium]|nr:hypothetical protein [Chloroflexota bacterium]